jgi:hypothetical protein
MRYYTPKILTRLVKRDLTGENKKHVQEPSKHEQRDEHQSGGYTNVDHEYHKTEEKESDG